MPGALMKPAEAAKYLSISTKLLAVLTKAGEIKCINVGCGKKNQARRYTIEDLDAFTERRAQRDVPCQSIHARTPRSTTSISSTRVVAFTALRDA